MSNSNHPLLEVLNIKKQFSVTTGGRFLRREESVYAVDGVDLSIYEKEILGLVGESGCGKTTLARLILRLIDPTDGYVFFNGQDVTRFRGGQLKNLRRQMQLIFQDPYGSLNSLMKVGSIIEEPLRVHGIADKSTRKKLVNELLETVGLDAQFINSYPVELSGGQRQRVGIARALVVKPRLVICDEPVSALDISIRAQIINLLLKLQSDLGLAYIYISHDLNLVQRIVDRIAVMYLGRIVEIASNDEMFSAPQHPYTEALLSASPSADPRREQGRKRIILEGDPPSPIRRPSGCFFHPRCPIAQDVCKVEDPPLQEISGGHFVACHFAAPFPISSNTKETFTHLPHNKS